MATERVWTTETREWKARAELAAAIEARKHLECMMVFWTRKLEEVQGHLDETKANLDRWSSKEQELRSQIPLIAAAERDARKAALKAEMERVKAEMQQLEASDL